MSDFDSNKNVFEVLRRAAERVDGIAMYAFSVVIILLALVLQFHLEDLLPFHVRSQDHAWVLLFVPPAVFVMYVCLGTWSRSDSRREQIWNATIIVVGGIYTIYKNYF